ncbi:MAG: class I SAM-dependent methyltransferase [Patescibacteria group bacterium]|nr:class I SAM-dependent methyltransferase [Actinomycetota bacterium]MCL5438478.1 class I SAM-dependent methyltransferase [Patescibacteria group bacterium]
MIKRIKAKLKKYINASSDFGFYRLLKKELEGYDSVLDVGCGVSSPLSRIDRPSHLEGIDLVPAKSVNKIFDKYKKGNILLIEKHYKNKSFDVVVLFHVLEHLKRSEGKVFLKKLEKIAKKKIIICTPNGFIPQDPHSGNIYQEHLSGWFVKDFKTRGYKIYGIRGFRFIRGEFAAIKYKPWYFWLFLSYLSEYITIYFPQLSFELMAVKTLRR